MSNLNEIIKAANKPCITDISAIERIVARLAEQPAKLFKCKTSEPLPGVVSDFLMDCEMDKSRYLDVLLTLFYYTKNRRTLRLSDKVNFAGGDLVGEF